MDQILFPVGRLVGGSVSKLHDRYESDGKTKKLDKDGNPSKTINFGVAIPKTTPTWQQTEWGKVIHDMAKAAYPVLHQSPAFAWKVIDGDSPLPNKNGKAPKDQEGYAGHWVIWFSQGWAPKLVNSNGQHELPAEQFVAGYYVQVLADVAPNGAQPPNTPGMYMNPRAVALAGEGDVINLASEVDTTSVGFGAAPLPVGARPVQPAVAEFSNAPFVPNAAFPSPSQPATAMPASPSSTVVTPSTAFMQPPAVPVSPVAQHVMTPKTNGATYEQMIATGWTDELLRQHGMML